MDRRKLLESAALGMTAFLAGCGQTSRSSESTTTSEGTTPFPTQSSGETIRIGPSEADCPSRSGDFKHWGEMNRKHEMYNATVESLSEAKGIANRWFDDDSTQNYTAVQPRPSRIAWQTETYNVTQKYGTDKWVLLRPANRGYDRATLVVQESAQTVRVVRFTVGDC